MILDLIRRGDLDVDSLISHRVAPSEVDAIFDGLAHRQAEFFGVIFDWSRS